MPFFSLLGSIFANFDFLALGKGIAKGALLLGTIGFVISSSIIILNALKSLMELFIQVSSELDGMLSSGSSGGSEALSCFYYFVGQLGIDIVFNSLAVSLVSILLIWVGISAQLFIIRLTLIVRSYAAEALT